MWQQSTDDAPSKVTLHLAEQVAAPALLGPMLDHLVHPHDRHKAAAVTLMTRLPTRISSQVLGMAVVSAAAFTGAVEPPTFAVFVV